MNNDTIGVLGSNSSQRTPVDARLQKQFNQLNEGYTDEDQGVLTYGRQERRTGMDQMLQRTFGLNAQRMNSNNVNSPIAENYEYNEQTKENAKYCNSGHTAIATAIARTTDDPYNPLNSQISFSRLV